MNQSDKGKYGENIAEGYLRGKGYDIVRARYKCVYGEIDIIAKQGAVLVFAEVKFRRTTKGGAGAEAITKTKQRSIIKAAVHYISTQKPPCQTYRFDTIQVFGREFYEITHIENAFYADGVAL